jgi:plasmid stabilization system protein ParE
MLHVITDCVVAWNPLAALDLEMHITNAAPLLAQFPQAARPGCVSGTRELVAHPNPRLV